MLKDNSKYIQTAEIVGMQIATTIFTDMLNPDFRAPKYNWDNLEEVVLNKIESDLFVYYDQRVFSKHKKQLLRAAKESASLTVQKCLANSNVKTWLPFNSTPDGGERTNDTHCHS